MKGSASNASTINTRPPSHILVIWWVSIGYLSLAVVAKVALCSIACHQYAS